LGSVSADDVRDAINVSSAEVPDAKVLKIVGRAEVTLELETDKEIDYSNGTDAEKEFIVVLAAMYAACYLTRGVCWLSRNSFKSCDNFASIFCD